MAIEVVFINSDNALRSVEGVMPGSYRRIPDVSRSPQEYVGVHPDRSGSSAEIYHFSEEDCLKHPVRTGGTSSNIIHEKKVIDIVLPGQPFARLVQTREGQAVPDLLLIRHVVRIESVESESTEIT